MATMAVTAIMVMMEEEKKKEAAEEKAKGLVMKMKKDNIVHIRKA
jgi:hypothetical protein